MVEAKFTLFPRSISWPTIVLQLKLQGGKHTLFAEAQHSAFTPDNSVTSPPNWQPITHNKTEKKNYRDCTKKSFSILKTLPLPVRQD